MKIKKFSEINEGLFDMIFDDPGNKKALRHYAGLKDVKYVISIDKPIVVETSDNILYEKFIRLLRINDIEYNVEEIDIEE